ncbi:hypothetical protein CL634_09320 [bacterium]|nr:hypothetical protein [bacterium]
MNQNNSIFARIIRVFNPTYGKLVEKPEKVIHGSNWATGYGVEHLYNQLGAMAVYATHGYTNAACSKIASDLAALPIRLIQGRGPTAKIIENHPLIDLLNQPSVDIDGYEFQAQIIIDFLLTGNAYILLMGPDKPISMARLHPEQMRVLTTKEGLKYYEFKDQELIIRYPKEKILHLADASWQTGPSSLYGTGKIQPLSLDIQTDINASRLVSESSKKGIPDLLISPSDPADIWNRERRKAILAEYQKMARDGGAMAISSQIQIKTLQVSARDMEFTEAKASARQTISACFGIPPSVLGLPSATYATAKIENQSYWEFQKHRARRLSAMWNKLARLWDPLLSVEYDFSGIPALQELRTSKIERIEKHVNLGMSIPDAYAYEGLSDAPVSRATIEDEETEEEEENRALLELIVSNFKPKLIQSKNYNEDEDSEEDTEELKKKENKE